MRTKAEETSSSASEKKLLWIKLIPLLLKAFYFTQVAPPAFPEPEAVQADRTGDNVLFLLITIIATGSETSPACSTSRKGLS